VPDGGSAAFRSFDAEALQPQTLYGYLAGGIGPRPIAFVATVSAGGTVNLAPYSFFNLFGIDPPVVGFSILQRLRDGSHKDTYRNLVATGECTIGAVPHALLYHQSIAAADYPPEVDEFQGGIGRDSRRARRAAAHRRIAVSSGVPSERDGCAR